MRRDRTLSIKHPQNIQTPQNIKDPHFAQKRAFELSRAPAVSALKYEQAFNRTVYINNLKRDRNLQK